MKIIALAALALLIAACQPMQGAGDGFSMADPTMGSGFWRPISGANVLLSPADGQAKLDFDTHQCRCGNFPRNAGTPVVLLAQQDQQRLAETGQSQAPGGGCVGGEQAVLLECMRARGWEPTSCTGNNAVGNGTLCAM